MAKSFKDHELQARYGQSTFGNFSITMTIGVPHPYCITPMHVAVASQHHSGILNEEAIKDCERNYGKCGICHGKLKYEQHETALLVICKKDVKGTDGKAVPELDKYLMSIKEKCEADGFAGFAFMKAT
jgi:hypothetical protein